MRKICAAAILLFACSSAQADSSWLDETRAKGDAAFKAGRFAEAYDHWGHLAFLGNPEMEERLGMLMLGPNAKHLKPSQRNRMTGISHIYLAAVGGRPSAMRILSRALRTGSSGARKLPAAAACWAKLPSDAPAISSCVAMTEFREKRSRPACWELSNPEPPTGNHANDGQARARLCLANRTPALYVYGPPPGKTDAMRWSEYQKHGIELISAGDVLSTDFDAFVSGFNSVMVEAIDATRGPGYLKRLEEKIEGAIEARYPSR